MIGRRPRPAVSRAPIGRRSRRPAPGRRPAARVICKQVVSAATALARPGVMARAATRESRSSGGPSPADRDPTRAAEPVGVERAPSPRRRPCHSFGQVVAAGDVTDYVSYATAASGAAGAGRGDEWRGTGDAVDGRRGCHSDWLLARAPVTCGRITMLGGGHVAALKKDRPLT